MRNGLVALVCGALVCGATVAGCSSAPAPASAATSGSPTKTAQVSRQDLKESTKESGTLGYGSTRDLVGDLGGTLTSLPAIGAIVGNGTVLYRIDTRPIVRFDGIMPAWRALGAGVDDGLDVKQLETALKGLGFADDLTVDDHWTPGTTAAVKAWQKKVGAVETGTIPLGEIVFTPGSLRVADVLATVGERIQPGTPVLKVGGATQLVTVALEPSQKGLAPVGRAVELKFPDGTAATGKVTAVRHQDAGEGAQESLQVTVFPTGGKELAKQVDGTSVDVTFTELIAKNALTVPVTALVALAGGGYGVQKVAADGSTTYVPVEPGEFADGLVAVSGDGLAEGDKVVVSP